MSKPTPDHPWVDDQKRRGRARAPRLFPPLPKRKGQYEGPSVIEAIKKFTDVVKRTFHVKDESWREVAVDYRELRERILRNFIEVPKPDIGVSRPRVVVAGQEFTPDVLRRTERGFSGKVQVPTALWKPWEKKGIADLITVNGRDCRVTEFEYVHDTIILCFVEVQ